MKPPPIPPERIAGELPDSVHGELRERAGHDLDAAMKRARRQSEKVFVLFVVMVAVCFIAALAGFAWVLIARHVI
jgi:t-SNARE complex subunit (syntaxin)